MSKNDLRLAVKREYFEQIKLGTKKYEYRLANDYWRKRIENKHYDTVTITLGYPKKDDKEKIMVFKYKGYTLKEIQHKHFGIEPVIVFAIDVSEVQDEINTK